MATPTPRPVTAPRPASPGLVFDLVDLDGERITSATTRGRVLCVLFVTTYDLGSQVAARRVDEVVAAYQTRARGVVIVLEAGGYAPLATAFRDTLSVALPVAMADPATLTGGGPFGDIERIPTLVVLDRDGRERERRFGVPSHAEIEASLLAALRPEGKTAS